MACTPTVEGPDLSAMTGDAPGNDATNRPTRVDLATSSLILSLCPGRDRAVGDDVADLRSNGAELLLSLVQPHEFPDSEGLAAAVHATGITWRRMPVVDFGVPEIAAWSAISPELHQRLDGRGVIAIHCWGGLGRTGTVAARLLVERGLSPFQAIAQIRALRPGAIETAEQANFVALGF